MKPGVQVGGSLYMRLGRDDATRPQGKESQRRGYWTASEGVILYTPLFKLLPP